MKLQISLLSVFLLTTIALQAQSFVAGYIVKDNGDTVTGYISDRVRAYNLKSVELRTDPKTEGPSYAIEDLKWVVFKKSSTFLRSALVDIDKKSRDVQHLDANMTKNIQQEHILLQLLASGKYELYKYTDERNETHFYLGENGKLQELYFVKYFNSLGVIQFFEEYKQQLKNAFADCPKASIPFSYSEGAMVASFKKYNKCVGQTDKRYDNSEKWKVIPHISAGIYSNFYDYGAGTSLATQRFETERMTTFVPSIVLEYLPTVRKVAVVPEMQISYRTTKDLLSSNGVKPPYNVDRFEYRYNLKFVSVALGARLVMLRYRPIRPYVRLLWGPNFTVSQHATQYRYSITGDRTAPVTLKKVVDGAFIGVGISTDYADIEIGTDRVGFSLKETDKRFFATSPYLSLSYRPFRPR